MIRNSAYLALAFGVIHVLVSGVGTLRAGGDAAFLLESLVASAMLIWGGWRTLEQGSSRLMSAAWGISVGALYIQLVVAWRLVAETGQTPTSVGLYTLIAFLVSAVGMCMSLARRPIE